MKTFPVAAILAVVALVLALLAILDIVKNGTALGLAVICLSLALLIPAAGGFTRDRDGI